MMKQMRQNINNLSTRYMGVPCTIPVIFPCMFEIMSKSRFLIKIENLENEKANHLQSHHYQQVSYIHFFHIASSSPCL